MSGRQRIKADPIEAEIERGLRPGAFIPDRKCSSFVRELEGVAAEIAEVAASDAARAVSLHETFLAGCYEKAEEVDDSSGGFAQLVRELFCGWIRARQAAGADPGETASRLLARMDHDPHDFCCLIERDAAQAFDEAGLAAFEKLLRQRLDAVASVKPAQEHLGLRWGEALRTIYLERTNVAAYVALAEEAGPTARDCREIATMLAARRKPEEALAWVERGLALDKRTEYGSMAGHELGELKRGLLIRLGRGDEARDAAWAEYREHPGKHAYNDLMKLVPEADRPAWHEKALAAAESARLDSYVELLIETRESERLADVVRRTTDDDLDRVKYYLAEPAARMLEKPHPDLAARVWRAQGMHILGAGLSRHYDAALSHFEHAMRCYQKAGLVPEWEKTVSLIRAEHRRKTGFMPEFETLVAGSGPSDQPSFLERARARWGKRLAEEDR